MLVLSSGGGRPLYPTDHPSDPLYPGRLGGGN